MIKAELIDMFIGVATTATLLLLSAAIGFCLGYYS